MTGSLRDDHVAQRPSEREEAAPKETAMRDSNCPTTDLQLTYRWRRMLLDSTASHDKTDQPVCVSQTEKIKLKINSLFHIDDGFCSGY